MQLREAGFSAAAASSEDLDQTMIGVDTDDAVGDAAGVTAESLRTVRVMVVTIGPRPRSERPPARTLRVVSG